MPIPDFQSAMLPVLQLTADGNDHTLAEAVDALAKVFKVTNEERNTVLPSGRQKVIYSRAGWAKTYLQKAGLLTATGRGRFQISARGREVLKGKPTRVDMNFLKQFPEYLAFQALTHAEEAAKAAEPADATPEEVLEESYQDLRRKLADELLDRIKACSPQFFEKLVVDLLVAMGYGGSHKAAPAT